MGPRSLPKPTRPMSTVTPKPEVRRAVVRGRRWALNCSSRWPWASVSPKPISDSRVRQAFHTHATSWETEWPWEIHFREHNCSVFAAPCAGVKSEGGHVRTLAQSYLKSQLSSSLTSGRGYLDAGELCQGLSSCEIKSFHVQNRGF